MRRVVFANKELYHIYNRGVDKRDIILDQNDVKRFLQSLVEFNIDQPIGSIYENNFKNRRVLLNNKNIKKLVHFICYSINPNHYHFILEQESDKGITKFMQRFGTGYTYYFNNKYKRSGALFQGRFKAVYINTDAYLLHLSAYINLNNKVHRLGGSTSKLHRLGGSRLGGSTSKLGRSSWEEYVTLKGVYQGLSCKKDIVLGQFSSAQAYKQFAQDALKDIRERRQEDEVLDALLIE